MASTNTVGTTIKKEHTDGARAYSSQQLVHSSSRVLHKEVKRELSPGLSPPTVQVCPINVVQGDSILVKLKYKEGQEYNYLIDGGHARHISTIEGCMRELEVTKKDAIQLHGIIVTHPDSDHMNGIKELLKRHGQEIYNKCDIVITKAFYWTSRNKPCEELTKLIESAYPTRDEIEAVMCLRPGLNCHFPTETGFLFRCNPKGDMDGRCIQESETFPKPKGADANETSILTVINESPKKCDVVLTGDSTAKKVLPLVVGKEIGIFQVPHHGSSKNSRLEESDTPDETKERFKNPLSAIHDRESIKKTVLFYGTFRAQCYLISAGGTGNYKHPDPEVLQGIILANALQYQECVILLTNSRGLDSEKLGQLYHLAPEWAEYVKIYHYDDVFASTEQQQHYTSLHPERCISDTQEDTVKWTPEEYMNRTKIMLPVELTMSETRPLEKNRFVEKSIVEITIQRTTTKFKAHIICVPIPHNPRSGDSINCCYVIEESIASGIDLSKALFLLKCDKTERLPRATQYILLQYVNNEWQKKELPATMKDIPPQTSPCHIPYDEINPLWPAQVPDSSPPNSSSRIQQSYHDIGSLQLGGETASAIASASNHSMGVQQQRGKAKEQSTVKPSLTQYPHQYNDDKKKTVNSESDPPENLKMVAGQGATNVNLESPTKKGCECTKGCTTKRCGCKKKGLTCGYSCKCTNCENNQ